MGSIEYPFGEMGDGDPPLTPPGRGIWGIWEHT